MICLNYTILELLKNIVKIVVFWYNKFIKQTYGQSLDWGWRNGLFFCFLIAEFLSC